MKIKLQCSEEHWHLEKEFSLSIIDTSLILASAHILICIYDH